MGKKINHDQDSVEDYNEDYDENYNEDFGEDYDYYDSPQNSGSSNGSSNGSSGGSGFSLFLNKKIFSVFVIILFVLFLLLIAFFVLPTFRPDVFANYSLKNESGEKIGAKVVILDSNQELVNIF